MKRKKNELEIAVFIPARRGEIAALTRADCDFKKNTIHISRSLADAGNKEWITKPPKTVAGDRIVEMPGFIMRELSAKGPGCIFSMNPDSITHYFEKIAKRAGVQCRFHDLRHYGASKLMSLGVPIPDIMIRGGWENDRVLREIYTHSLDESQRESTRKWLDYADNFSEASHKTSHNILKMA